MYLYGASGHAKVIIDILEAMGKKITALVDDNVAVETLQGYPVVHSAKGLSPFIISIGNNATRKKIAQSLLCSFETAIHPSAVVSKRATIGCGSVVMQGAIIQPDAVVGSHSIVNTGASIDHECFVGDYVHISPHATLCGNVSVGEGTWIGAGTTVIPGIKIGRWCVIGAGSVVSHDIPDGYLAVGNRCKLIKQINKNLL